jgi:hypothetical protein
MHILNLKCNCNARALSDRIDQFDRIKLLAKTKNEGGFP